MLFSLAANSLIDHLPSYQPLKEMDLTGRVAGLRDADVRAKLIEEGANDAVEPFTKMYLMPAGKPASYDYTQDDSIAGIAQATGVSPVEAYINAMVESDGKSIVNWPVMNQDHEAIKEQVLSPVTIMGLADAGAHATQIMDASSPPTSLPTGPVTNKSSAWKMACALYRAIPLSSLATPTVAP